MDHQLKQRMDELTEKVAAYISKQKQSLDAQKESHSDVINRLSLDKQRIESSLDKIKSQESRLNETLSNEINESQQSDIRIEALNSRHQLLQQETINIQQQVDDLSNEINSKREELFALNKNLSTNRDKDLPEVLLYEQLLGLKIVGVRNDLLKFIFININHKDPIRQYSLLLDVSEDDYKVPETSPVIDTTQVLQELNTSRDLATFLSKIRNLFKSQSI